MTIQYSALLSQGCPTSNHISSHLLLFIKIFFPLYIVIPFIYTNKQECHLLIILPIDGK